MDKQFKVLIIDSKDNVATALEDIEKNGLILLEDDKNGLKIRAIHNIKFGHKVAIININEGEQILKYGEAIGIANRSIKIGEHVHINNVESQRARGDLGN